jgi:hypothetical protein
LYPDLLTGRWHVNPVRGASILGVVVCVAFLFACDKENVVDASTTAAIGAQCSGPGDPGCGTTGACVLGFCRHGCNTDSECAQGALCLGSQPPYGCSLQSELGCKNSSPCAAPLACGIDGKCRFPCTTDADCPRNEHVCLAKTCVSRSEPNAESTWLSCNRQIGTALVRDGVFCDLTDMSHTKLLVCNVTEPGWVVASNCNCNVLEPPNDPGPGGYCMCDTTNANACGAEIGACLSDTACATCLKHAWRPACDALPQMAALRACNCVSVAPGSTCEQCSTTACQQSCAIPAGEPWTEAECKACMSTSTPAAGACASEGAKAFLGGCPCDICRDFCVEQCNQAVAH